MSTRFLFFFFLMIRRPPRSTLDRSSAASDVYKRQIVWPSQATGYKIGMLKILELREYARKNLGNRFDIRDFHDIVLTNGPLPLSLLSENVRTWVEKKQKEN